MSGGSDVIAYASVRLSSESAADCLRELGGQAGPATREYKASHVLRADRRSTVALLGPSGRIHGNALVHLTDKAAFVVGRVLDLLLGHSVEAASAGLVADPRLAGLAMTLSRDGPGAFGPVRWRAFLAAANAVVRIENPRAVREPVDAFIDLVETLDGPDRLRDVREELRRARPSAYAARAELIEHRVLQPAAEPLIPALARTILYWSRGGRSDVSIVHDEQSALTERRVRRLERQLLPAGRSLRFRQVDSRTDPRVQLADVLAGVARRLASDELHGRGDAELGALLRAYLEASCRGTCQPPAGGLGTQRRQRVDQ